MINNYFRPRDLVEAQRLLKQPDTFPIGGGTWINQPHNEMFAVVDLQELGLGHIQKTGNNLTIGACVTLQQLLESPDCPEALKKAIRIEAGLNIRNAATIAGVIVTCTGRSAFATVLLSLDAKLEMVKDDGAVTIGIGEFLPLRPRNLITSISIPLNTKTSFESIARTTYDLPIVCAAVTQWSSGRTRLALGGFRQAPLLAMDGTEADGLQEAARNAFHEAGDDWASSDYRQESAAVLAQRCFEFVNRRN